MPAGRPTEYDPERCPLQAHVACAEGGFTDEKLAKLFSVSRTTIHTWKKEYPEFLNAIKSGKDEWDCLIAEKCLLKRVTGFRYSEKTKEPGEDGELQVTKVVSKAVAPDVKACEIWLCNRHPDRWKRVKHVELTGKDGGPVATDGTMRWADAPPAPRDLADWEAQVKAANAAEATVAAGDAE